MTIQALQSRLGGPSPSRRTAPPPAVHYDEIGELPPGIAVGPGAAGAQLHDVLALVQRSVPSATGVVVRNGRLFVTHAQPPDDTARAAARAALADHASLAQLASQAAASAAAPTSATPAQLRAQLLDAGLPDDAWLRAFRRYQVALLSAQPAPGDTR